MTNSTPSAPLNHRPQITIFDTAASSKNLGDEIIMDAVTSQLQRTLPGAFFVTVATHDVIGRFGKKLLRDSALSVVGGTNLLTSDFRKYNQWRITWKDAFWLRRAVLLGVGWWQYQHKPTAYTSRLLRTVLHKQAMHSLRDQYSCDQIKLAGVNNTLNTSCVTLWDFDAEHQSKLPKSRGGSVIATITDYKPNPKLDRALMDTLLRSYDRVYLWIQGAGDYRYVRENLQDEIEIVDPNLNAFDEILSSSINLDYVGTRLHAGIRAIANHRRALILSVDNRAEEIGKDTGLPVHPRENVAALKDRIDLQEKIAISLPTENIEAWRRSLRVAAGYD